MSVRARALAWAMAAGGAHGGLSLWLASAQEVPSFGTLWIPVERHYLVQGCLLPFLGPAAYFAYVWVLRRLVDLDIDTVIEATYLPALAPILIAYSLPELALYGALGFDGLKYGVQIFMPLAILLAFVGSLMSVRAMSGLGWIRSYFTVVVASAVPVLMFGAVIR